MVLKTNLEEILFLRKGHKSNRKMTVVTPSMRPMNLLKVFDSMDFSYIDEWIIVYDGSKINENPKIFKHPKIREYVFFGEGNTGNPQRNYGIDRITNKDTYLYFLDDDNFIHEDLYKLLSVALDGEFYTFDQQDGIKGDQIAINQIDTGMFLVDFQIAQEVRWYPHCHASDFYYINECYCKNKSVWVYLNSSICYYNKMSSCI